MHTIGARGLVANKSDAALREVSIVGMSVALAGNDQQITSETLISSRQFLDRASFRHRVRKPGLNRTLKPVRLSRRTGSFYTASKHLRLSIATLTVYSASCRRIENLPMWTAPAPMIGWCLVLGHGCDWPSLLSCWADRSLRLMVRRNMHTFKSLFATLMLFALTPKVRAADQ